MAEIGIVGAGVAGLTAANYLRKKGHEVTVFDSSEKAGGKLVDFRQAGFRFDAGPSLFTVPHLLDAVFEATEKNPRDYFDYRQIDPACHYFWPDGTKFSAPSDVLAFAKAAAKTFKVSAECILDYFKKSGQLYDLTEDVFLKSSLHKAKTYFKISTLKSALKLGNANLLSTMNAVNERRLEHPKLIQLFNRYATYNGSDPYRAPGTLTVIPTLEHRWGTHLPVGGMYRITQSLYQLAKDLGVTFRFNEKVLEILLKDHSVSGLRTALSSYPFDTVVSNMDVVPTYQRLLPKLKIPKRIKTQERSSSAVIFYWGIDAQMDDLGLHNIFWSEDYKKEFTCLFENQDISDDPTIYVNITSKWETDDAPKGMENWFVMVNAPCIAGQNWKDLVSKTRKNVLNKLSRMLGRDLGKLIITEKYHDPVFLSEQTSSHLGSLYGTSSNSRMAAFFRHPNFSSQANNLYFCGGSVHPGGGIPLCLHSGKIVSDLIG